MPRILFWVLHRPERSPSQRFRFEQYLAYLQANGYDYAFSYVIDEHDDKVFYQSGNYLGKLGILWRSIWKRRRDLRQAQQYDIVFVQRECFMLGSAFFERQMAKRTKLVFDFDDAIWLPAVSEGNKALGFLKNPNKIKKIIAASHLVLAGNDYLADYARQFNPDHTIVIPTTVDTDLFTRHPYPPRDRVCIGWSGSFSTIPHFEHAIPALRQLKAKYGDKIYFKVIGDARYRHDELGIQGIAWTKEDEVFQLSELDIGLMPLPDDEWTKGKCGLKGLTYMSLAIPTIMSPVGVNPSIIQHAQNGFLATSTEEWVQVIASLIDDPALRQRIGNAGRQTVLDRYSVHAQKDRYLQAFNQLCGR